MEANAAVLDFLKEVTIKLPLGWRIDSNITTESFLAIRESSLPRYNYFLFNQSGAFISVNHSQRGQSTLKIGFFNPKHKKHFWVINSINMNLDKGISRVANDINSRLLSCLPKVMEELKSKRDELETDINKNKFKELVINSIKLTSKSRWEDRGYGKYYLHQTTEITSERARSILKRDTTENNKATINQHHDKPELFNLDLHSLTPEQVIKIMAFLEL